VTVTDLVAGLALAALHSKAVDYVKTGIPADMPRALEPQRWPHFMGKSKDRSYTSSTALGQIYNRVQQVKFNPLYNNSFDKRILHRYELDDGILEKARKLKTEYDTAVRRIMGQRAIATEFEIFTGFCLSRPKVGSDYKLQEDLGVEATSLKQRFRDLCYEVAGGRDQARIYPFVAAMYKVTEEEVKIVLEAQRGMRENNKARGIFQEAAGAKEMPLISFPWIFHGILGRIATDGVKKGEIQDFVEVPSRMRVHALRNPSEEGKQGIVPAQEAATHLGDGRIVHRGDILNLFDAHVDYTESQGSERRPDEPDHFLDAVDESSGQLSIHVPTPSGNGVLDTPLESQGSPHLVRAATEAEAVGGDAEGEANLEIDEDNAVDRLLKLMGGSEE
jgi:RNA-dependent RNA polymerase